MVCRNLLGIGGAIMGKPGFLYISAHSPFNSIVKITENPNFQLLETRGVYDEDSHHASKDKSKFLKFKQLDSARQFRLECAFSRIKVHGNFDATW